MTHNLNYLSDEELELLIADIEQNELVSAPPDILEKVLEQSTNNIREFRRYCFRICASVAAAVVLVFVLPVMSENLAMYLPKQEVSVAEQKYATKEDALNDDGYLLQKFGGTNIFSGERNLGIFNGKNGG